jgi:hypothetical protein
MYVHRFKKFIQLDSGGVIDTTAFFVWLHQVRLEFEFRSSVNPVGLRFASNRST